ncbi:Bug family tripartite tricarboxylate transporter substrate binding protein [Cupriavidus sp. PET2-C1]
MQVPAMSIIAIRVATAIVLAVTAASSFAQAGAAYPSRPITYIVPYAPGGTNDNVARIISKRLAEKTGQGVLVEYKPGAGGTLGAGYVAHAPADGYTLLNTSIGNLAIAPQLVKTTFDPFLDFVPVAYIGNSRATVAVNPHVPARNLKELIAYAKANPGKLTYATSGNGTPGHIAGELLKSLAGIDMRHVPYKGSAPAVADVIAGHVDVVFDPLSTASIKAGKLRALAFFGSETSPELPGVPSIAQAGVNGWENALGGSFFISAPKDTPASVLAALRGWLNEILREPATIQALARVEVETRLLTPEQTKATIRSVHDLSRRIIQNSGTQL